MSVEDDLFYIELPNGLRFGLRAIEAHGDRWILATAASDAEWLEGALLSARRVRRCRWGSETWWRHRAVILEAERRCGVRLLSGGAA